MDSQHRTIYDYCKYKKLFSHLNQQSNFPALCWALVLLLSMGTNDDISGFVCNRFWKIRASWCIFSVLFTICPKRWNRYDSPVAIIVSLRKKTSPYWLRIHQAHFRWSVLQSQLLSAAVYFAPQRTI